jgi:hypothetical protein
MKKTVAKCFVYMVIFLMIFECITAAVIQPEAGNSFFTSIHCKSSIPSLLTSSIFEKTEEEEKGEEERSRFVTIELADLTEITAILSRAHTPNTHHTLFEHWFDHHPSLQTLFCVFVI